MQALVCYLGEEKKTCKIISIEILRFINEFSEVMKKLTEKSVTRISYISLLTVTTVSVFKINLN